MSFKMEGGNEPGSFLNKMKTVPGLSGRLRWDSLGASLERERKGW